MAKTKITLVSVVFLSFFLAYSSLAANTFPVGEKDDLFDTTACQKNDDPCSTSTGAMGLCYNKVDEWGCYEPDPEENSSIKEDIFPGGGTEEDDTFPGGGTAETANGYTSNGLYIPTADETGLSDMPIKDILMNLLTWMLGIVGVIALIGFVISGIQYILSTGQEKPMESAKRNMMYSIMGVVVVLASLVIVQAIDFALRGRGTF